VQGLLRRSRTRGGVGQGEPPAASRADGVQAAAITLPNVRAERTTEAGCLGPATDNMHSWLLPAQGGLPRRVRSRARG
jgi:hypothetical protein